MDVVLCRVEIDGIEMEPPVGSQEREDIINAMTAVMESQNFGAMTFTGVVCLFAEPAED